MVLIMGTDCIVCEVRTEVAYAILRSVTFKWFTAMQEVCLRFQKNTIRCVTEKRGFLNILGE